MSTGQQAIDPELAAHVEALELSHLRPDVRRSTETLTQLLAADILEIGSSGRLYSRADILSNLASELEMQLTMSGFQAKLLAPGLVLTTYQVEKTVPASGKQQRSLRSSIWREQAGRWQLVFHQGTIRE